MLLSLSLYICITHSGKESFLKVLFCGLCAFLNNNYGSLYRTYNCSKAVTLHCSGNFTLLDVAMLRKFGHIFM